eukprot:1992122-Pleurochrysis_carterae.AAC.11
MKVNTTAYSEITTHLQRSPPLPEQLGHQSHVSCQLFSASMTNEGRGQSFVGVGSRPGRMSNLRLYFYGVWV